MDQVRMESKGGTEGEVKGTPTFTVLHIHTLLGDTTHTENSQHPSSRFPFPQGKHKQHAAFPAICLLPSPHCELGFTLGEGAGRGEWQASGEMTHLKTPRLAPETGHKINTVGGGRESGIKRGVWLSVVG